MSKSNLWWTEFISPYGLQSIVKGCQSKNSRMKGTDDEAMEECHLQAYSKLSLLSYTILDHQPWDSSTHNRLGPSLSIPN